MAERGLLSMKIGVEFELNRGWIYDNEGEEIIGETNFVVPSKWLMELFNKNFVNDYFDFDVFLDVYEPEVDGEFIYQKAIEDGVLVEDFGVVMY